MDEVDVSVAGQSLLHAVMNKLQLTDDIYGVQACCSVIECRTLMFWFQCYSDRIAKKIDRMLLQTSNMTISDSVIDLSLFREMILYGYHITYTDGSAKYHDHIRQVAKKLKIERWSNIADSLDAYDFRSLIENNNDDYVFSTDPLPVTECEIHMVCEHPTLNDRLMFVAANNLIHATVKHAIRQSGAMLSYSDHGRVGSDLEYIYRFKMVNDPEWYMTPDNTIDIVIKSIADLIKGNHRWNVIIDNLADYPYRPEDNVERAGVIASRRQLINSLDPQKLKDFVHNMRMAVYDIESEDRGEE